MASTIKIDGYDLWPYLRVNPGEGFEPANPDLVEPHFIDSSLAEGQPLVNITTKNREIVLPVHLTPKFSGGSYANTRDGLNTLIRDVGLQLKAAKRLEWKDENSTNSTWFDVQFARFEPEYNYRRAQANMLSGNVHFWTKPYGDTATTRIVATSIATGLVCQVAIPTIAGDVNANVDIYVKAGATTPIAGYSRDGRIVGYSVVPSGYIAQHPAASLLAGLVGTLVGAPDAAGSQYVWGFGYDGRSPTMPITVAQLRLNSASVYAGKQRFFAIARTENTKLFGRLEAFYNGVPFVSKARVPSLIGAYDGWSTVDLGVVEIDPTWQATALIQIRGYNASHVAYNVSHLLSVPEEKTTFITDLSRRTLSSFDVYPTAPGAFTLDNVGNAISNGGLINVATAAADYSTTTGRIDTTASTAGFVVEHDKVNDLQVFARGAAFSVGDPSTFIDIGKVMNPSNAIGTSMSTFLRFAGNATRTSIAVFSGQAVLLASVGIATFTSNYGPAVIEYAARGPVVFGSIRVGSSVATVSGSSAHNEFNGQTFTRFIGKNGRIDSGFGAAYSPSRPMNLGDQYHWNASIIEKLATIGQTQMDTYQRAPIVQIEPGVLQQVVAFNLPVDGEDTTDFVSVDVRVNERFSFAR